MDEQLLKERFAKDVGCSLTHYRMDEVWQQVWGSYREVWRWYHNLQHIVECLDLCDKHFRDATSYIRAAVWFHDVVYRCPPGAVSNEELSAAWAAEALRLLDVPLNKDRMANLIRATTYKRPPLGGDEYILHDLDFAILGAERSRFSQYCAGINYEYNWLPAESFVEHRIVFLQALLDREHIYCTDVMRGAYEAQAKANITRELEDPSWAA